MGVLQFFTGNYPSVKQGTNTVEMWEEKEKWNISCFLTLSITFQLFVFKKSGRIFFFTVGTTSFVKD